MFLLTRNCMLLRLKEVKPHPSPIGNETPEHMDLCSNESLLKSSTTYIPFLGWTILNLLLTMVELNKAESWRNTTSSFSH